MKPAELNMEFSVPASSIQIKYDNTNIRRKRKRQRKRRRRRREETAGLTPASDGIRVNFVVAGVLFELYVAFY